ncbi:MAG: ATP phosphoribosyltransferase regulatory subunit, partial [Eubacteriales bacterium]
MERSSLGLRLPDGLKDLLPRDLALLEDLENKAVKVFKDWSYDKVMTPALEYRACVEADSDREDNLYKLFDSEGRILALRPEFTTPITRMISSRKKSDMFPLRICYSGDVYRNSSDSYREFRQAGVELIGSESDMADAEILALAV